MGFPPPPLQPSSAAATDWRFASALSDAPETHAAIEQVLHQLRSQLSHRPAAIDWITVFATAHHRDGFELIHQQLADNLHPRVTVGMTAEGVIGVGREIELTPGLAILAASLPGVAIDAFSYEQIDWPSVLEDPQALRQQWQSRHSQPLRAVLLLADPFSTPMVRLLPALSASWPGVPVAGGMASAARMPGGNRLLINGQVLRDGAVGLAISGDIRVDCTVSQGCRPIGKPYVITRSQRHVVQELGGRKAMAVLQELLEQLTQEERELVQTNGLLVGRVIDEYKDRFGRGDFLIRGLMGVDQESGYVAIGDPQVRVGQTIQFHVRDQKTAQEDFSLLLDVQQLHGPAAGALLFNCNGRGMRLFDHPHADAITVRQSLGDVPLAGVFAAGEIGPVGGENFVHGHTASLVVFRPAKAGSTEHDSPPK